jgi:hypothetical protein
VFDYGKMNLAKKIQLLVQESVNKSAQEMVLLVQDLSNVNVLKHKYLHVQALQAKMVCGICTCITLC